MSKAKTREERHFYITLCIKESYSARELDRQINSGYYERYMLSKEKLLQVKLLIIRERTYLSLKAEWVTAWLSLDKDIDKTLYIM